MPLQSKIRTALTNPQRARRYLTRRAGIRLSSRGLLGTNVFERDWDVLILLDTCRVDALRAVASEYDFLGDMDRLCSVGASSSEWIGATFDRRWRDEISRTAYLACNGYADFVFESNGNPDKFLGPAPPDYYYQGSWNFATVDDLGHLEHLWRYERGDEESVLGHDEGGTPPRYVTDRGISVARESTYDRLILHYTQPHHPYTANAIGEDRALYDYEREPFDFLTSGGNREKVLRAYLDELRYVLDDVELLLRNIDADNVVISADHGEAFGERGDFGHPIGSLNPVVRYVPWARTNARDSKEYVPEFDPDYATERGVNETLRNLGYIE